MSQILIFNTVFESGAPTLVAGLHPSNEETLRQVALGNGEAVAASQAPQEAASQAGDLTAEAAPAPASQGRKQRASA
jgi:hypothetical protein